MFDGLFSTYQMVDGLWEGIHRLPWSAAVLIAKQHRQLGYAALIVPDYHARTTFDLPLGLDLGQLAIIACSHEYDLDCRGSASGRH